MKHAIRASALGMGFGIAALAHAAPLGGSPEPASSISVQGERKWTTTIQPVNQFRFNAADSTRDRSYGNAQWSAGMTPMQSNVNLVFSYAGTERGLTWAILFGRCGIASLPVVPTSTFPELDVSGGGRAQLNATIPIELPTSGTYHIELYKDRTGGAESMVACGNFRYINAGTGARVKSP